MQVDALIAGVGTGGTITGCGEFLKSKKPSCQIIGVEPAESPVLSGGKPGERGPRPAAGGGLAPSLAAPRP